MRSRAALEYLWLADLDPDRYPCVTAKKNATTCQHLHLQVDRIAVVAPEIEAWYLAGLDRASCEALRIPECQDTNSLTKEGFSKLIPTKYRSEIDFRMDVLGTLCTSPWHSIIARKRLVERGEEMEQPTFADLEYAQKKRKTRREKFLERMDALLPWAEMEARIARVLSQGGAWAAAVSLVGDVAGTLCAVVLQSE